MDREEMIKRMMDVVGRLPLVQLDALACFLEALVRIEDDSARRVALDFGPRFLLAFVGALDGKAAGDES